MPVREAAELFMKYDYAETKDLCKEFLTLVSGILVFSLAFAEKIVNVQRSTRWARFLLLSTWVLFIGSIISCGLGLVYIALAGGQAIYGSGYYYLELANTCWRLVIVGGLLFILGLATLVAAAIVSLFASQACPSDQSAGSQ
jgi:hypothetical protein